MSCRLSTSTARLVTGARLGALCAMMAMVVPMRAQQLATLEVSLDYPSAGILVPVHVTLDAITTAPDSLLTLVEIQGRKKVPVPFQVETGTARTLTWLVPDTRGKHVYALTKTEHPSAVPSGVQAVKQDGALTLKSGNQNLLRYQYTTLAPPAGVNPVFGRSAFIHPLWSPHGQVLTRIQPPDHYHHYGLWNPWTHVLFEGDTVDFWNLGSRQGTVRFADFVSASGGPVYGHFAAVQEHVAFAKWGGEKTALTELQTVRVYAPEGKDYYIADITVQLNCAAGPVRLLEYRYGGMGWRATEAWTKENSRVLTSEGKSRKDADGSRARWCIVEGAIDGENAGAVMMSYPLNYNYPEPLRIWPENANRNRGDMFANFSPTKDRDWQLTPGNDYVLRYRFIIFNGTFPKEKAEAAWHYFASPPMVKVQPVKN